MTGNRVHGRRGRLRAAVGLVAVAAVVVPAAPASAQATPGEAVSDHLVIGFADGVSSAARSGVLEDAGATPLRELRGVRAVVARPREGRLLSDVRRALVRARGVRYVERDFRVAASATPDDPLLAAQYGLAQPSDDDVDAPEAWSTRTACAKIAVLDTGIDRNHPDLASNVWRNPDETKDNGKDDDKNGYVDDYYGADVRDDRGSAVDEEGHGTHVAGTIGARGDNAVGVAGICWTAPIMAVKFLGEGGRGSTSGAVEAIEYAVREGAKIVNCSFGSSSKSEALQDAVTYAKERGVLLVVAAGNDGEDIDRTPVYPAAYGDGNILTVAASTSADRLAAFSNFGDTNVDVAAPGDEVLSTWPGGGYRELSGTSMAAPLVAGAAAMLRQQDPDATYSELRTALRTEVDEPPGLAGKVLYDGRLNVARALASVR